MSAQDQLFSDELILYHHRYSYYSQKVLLALHEKGLPFVSKPVDMARGDQYKPWFLKLSPKGEVPILVYKGQVTSGSVRILNQLENIGAGKDKIQTLLPKDSEAYETIQHFRHLIDLVPVGAVTMASFLHRDYIIDAKPPFNERVRDLLLNAAGNSSSALRERARNVDEQESSLLLKKAEAQERMRAKLGTPEQFEALLKQIDLVLQQIEHQLAVNIGINELLCSKTFTLADVSLTILLHRLDALGLGHRFWSTDLKPNLNAYYQKVQSREGFKRTVPDMKYHLSAVAHNAPTYMLAGFGISVTALAVLTSLSVYKVMQ
ncbi:ganglioside-induced differentiation-associated protein 1-like [Ctenocephalides felis]|uniref:ganglioside-induced differentiation-associated protein 1-like n=1 Tax=Ctenocephalides felis TaxID=7515 RepID=UPI000E6E32BC|nr:ganglioside-induced differentiation-associated protein 1-like [Ctenocephalides felis]